MARKFTWFIAAMTFTMMIGLAFASAKAGGLTVNNHYHETPTTNVTEVTEITTITEGVDSGELARGIATAAAVNHQFDFSYSGWQGSVNGAFYDGENAVSFGIANRFEWMDKALIHSSFTENGGEQLWTVGGTFRF